MEKSKLIVVMAGFFAVGVLAFWWALPSRNGVDNIDIGAGPQKKVMGTAQPVQPGRVESQNKLVQQGLEQQLSELKKEVEVLKRREDTDSAPLVASPPVENAYPEMVDSPQLEQAHEEAKVELANRMAELEDFLNTGIQNEAEGTKLQQQLQDALVASGMTQDIALKASQCSAELCKVEIVGAPADGKDMFLMLAEQNFFAEGTEVMSVPDQTGANGVTLYIAQSGKPLPSGGQ